MKKNLLVLCFFVFVTFICFGLEVKIDDADAGGDRFGYSVSLSGDYAIGGAYLDAADANNAGAAYIFQRDGADWDWKAKLTADDGAEEDYFGWSVAISGDYAIVGAFLDDNNTKIDNGAAYIFHRDGVAWTQHYKLSGIAAGDDFGWAVDISGDYAIVGAWDQGVNHNGAIHIFHRNGATWSLKNSFTGTGGGDYFGRSVAIDGNYAIVGAISEDTKGQDAGAAYTYYYNGTNWTFQSMLTALDGAAHDNFGNSVGISGDYAVVGSWQDDNDGLKSGSAYIFYRNQGGVDNWGSQTKLTALDGEAKDQFGFSVSIFGDYVLVGANKENSSTGAVYAFLRNGVVWNQTDKQIASDGATYDWFGCSVCITQDYSIIGAEGDDGDSFYSGSAYIYDTIGDFSLPVTLSSFNAVFENNAPLLLWTTLSETNNLGWNVYRSETDIFEEASQINTELIPGAGSTSEPTDYIYEDESEFVENTEYWYWLESVDYSGLTESFGSISLIIPEEGEEPGSPEVPGVYGLHQNYPNPFNPSTEISFMLKENCIAELSVYNIKGEKISTLFQKKSVSKDELIRINWDGKDDFGKSVSSGIYLYKLRTNKADFVRKMILLK